MESNKPGPSKHSPSALESKTKSTNVRKNQLTEKNAIQQDRVQSAVVDTNVTVLSRFREATEAAESKKGSASKQDQEKSEEKPESKEGSISSNSRDSCLYHAFKLRKKQKIKSVPTKLDPNDPNTKGKSTAKLKEVRFENTIPEVDKNKSKASKSPEQGGSKSKSDTKSSAKRSSGCKTVHGDEPISVAGPSGASDNQHEATVTPTDYKTTFETWQPGKTKVICPNCNAHMLPIFRRTKEKPTCLISCWPCLVRPFVNSSGIDQIRMFCSNCNSLIGVFNSAKGVFETPQDSDAANK